MENTIKNKYEEKKKIENKLKEKYKGKFDFKDNGQIFNLIQDIYKLSNVDLNNLPVDVEKILSEFGIDVNVNPFYDGRDKSDEYMASIYLIDSIVTIRNPFPIYQRQIMARNLAYHMLKILKHEDKYSCAGFKLPYSHYWIPCNEIYLKGNMEDEDVYFIEAFSSMLLVPVKTLSNYLVKKDKRLVDPREQLDFLNLLSQETQSSIDIINQAMFLYKFIPEKVYVDNDLDLYKHDSEVEKETVIEIKLPWRKS